MSGELWLRLFVYGLSLAFVAWVLLVCWLILGAARRAVNGRGRSRLSAASSAAPRQESNGLGGHKLSVHA